MAAPDVRPRARPAGESLAFERPYPPGWFDRLIDLIDRTPGPNWLFPVVLLLAEASYVTGLLWWNGKLPVGQIDFSRLFIVVVAPYLIGARFYLDRVACAALDDFRPALAVDDAEFRRLRYELTTLPARTSHVVTALVVTAFLVNWGLAPPWFLEQYSPSQRSGLVEMGPIGLFTFAVAALSVAQAVHQLQMVQTLHDRAASIRLFRTKPLYAFSPVAAQTGMSLLLLIYYVGAVRPDIVLVSPPLRGLMVAMVATAVACFVLPLRGMHRRIAAEKGRALAQSALRLEALTARLHERVEQGVLEDADKLNQQLTSLITERDALNRVSTWPWEPATLTAFVTTMVLPAIVWVLQRVLAKMGL
jgi:hypothetical protein